jgi:hypothetical protein
MREHRTEVAHLDHQVPGKDHGRVVPRSVRRLLMLRGTDP